MKNIQFDFSGRHALITGGGQGIGRKITEDFLSSHAKVTVWDKSLKHFEQIKNKNLFLNEVDVSSKQDCETAAKALSQPIDFLINNAGILKDKSFSKMTYEDYNLVIQTNLNGVFLVTKSVLNFFTKEYAFKRIVNLSSVAALYGNFGQSNYVAAKAGVLGLTKVWARELSRKSFTVNALAPGFIKTDILKNMPEQTLKALMAKVPVGRMGEVEDVSSACLFICSKEASYINGAVLEVTGGVTL